MGVGMMAPGLARGKLKIAQKQAEITLEEYTALLWIRAIQPRNVVATPKDLPVGPRIALKKFQAFNTSLYSQNPQITREGFMEWLTLEISPLRLGSLR